MEKDNPVAPQPYVGPRRRRALARAAGQSDIPAGMEEILRTLTEAAERFVTCMPHGKKTDRERSALWKAITQAQLLLSVEHRPLKRPARAAKRR